MKGLLAVLGGVVGLWLLFNLVGAFVVGLIARAVFPARDRVGWGKTLLVGFLGGILGKLLFHLLGWPRHFIMGFVASVVGAFILLLGLHVWTASKSSPRAGT